MQSSAKLYESILHRNKPRQTGVRTHADISGISVTPRNAQNLSANANEALAQH